MAERKQQRRRNYRQRRRKVCSFCVSNQHKSRDAKDRSASIDYKNSDMLRKYVSDRGKILPRRVTGTCAKHQRELTVAIKRARHMALIPFTKD
jgi:small subunit ribosomal protein S18